MRIAPPSPPPVPSLYFLPAEQLCEACSWWTKLARSPLRRRREDNGTFHRRRGNSMKNKMIIALRNKRIVPNIKGLFCERSQIRLAWDDVLRGCSRDRRVTTTTAHQKGNQWLERVWRSAPSQAFREQHSRTLPSLARWRRKRRLRLSPTPPPFVF